MFYRPLQVLTYQGPHFKIGNGFPQSTLATNAKIYPKCISAYCIVAIKTHFYVARTSPTCVRFYDSLIISFTVKPHFQAKKFFVANKETNEDKLFLKVLTCCAAKRQQCRAPLSQRLTKGHVAFKGPYGYIKNREGWVTSPT